MLRNQLKLYLVTDDRLDGESLLPIVREAISGGATAIQLRRKNEEGRRFVEIGRAIRTITREAGVLFFVNDRVDIAILTDADGVHIGQSDITLTDARRLMGDKIIGVSACTVAEAHAALQGGADYLGVGSIYPTASKLDADMCGLDGLAQIARDVQIPIVAIGGISRVNAADVMKAGADGVAVVSCIMSADDPRQATAELLRVL